jgi:hypothetical protein
MRSTADEGKRVSPVSREDESQEAEKPMGKRVAIWLRVSTEDQARGESPEHHEAADGCTRR